MTPFNETQPIFVQIRQRIAAMILSETAKEGEALPSVRSIAADLSVNPLTVTRAYESLVNLGVVESRRGTRTGTVHGRCRNRRSAYRRPRISTPRRWPASSEAGPE